MINRRAFTLVELLVVVAIIALLLAMLLPALNKAKEVASQVRCAANMRQIGVAVTGYTVDNRGVMPYAGWWDWPNWRLSWDDLIDGHIGGKRSESDKRAKYAPEGTRLNVYHCPKDTFSDRYTYSMNESRMNPTAQNPWPSKPYGVGSMCDYRNDGGGGKSPAAVRVGSDIKAASNTIAFVEVGAMYKPGRTEFYNIRGQGNIWFANMPEAQAMTSITWQVTQGVPTLHYDENHLRNYLYCDGSVRFMHLYETIAGAEDEADFVGMAGRVGDWSRDPND